MKPTKRGLAPSHPGALLRDVILPDLKARGIARAEVARLLGVGRRTLYDVLDATRPVTPELALRLEALGLGSAESWMNHQQAYDLWRAREALAAELAGVERIWPPADDARARAA